jgi:hypothetical protein
MNMRRGSLFTTVLALCGITNLVAAPCRAQSAFAGETTKLALAEPTPKSAGHGSPGVGVGVRISALGIGAEMAVGVSHRINLRGGFSVLSYSRGFNKDGVTFTGQLNLRSAEAHLDLFPFAGGFHVSPGLLFYNGNNVGANAAVPGGQTFSLGGTDYMSDPANPITGIGKLDFVKAAPTILVGWGNLVPRNHKHFSFNTEIGVVFQQAPRTALSMAGGACDPSGLNCVNAATDLTVQANIISEVVKINNSVSPFKFYPVLSFGFGYKF